MKIEKSGEVGNPVDYLVLPDGLVEIWQSNWERGFGKLFTTGVASCVVLAAHNEVTQEGLLGHFSAISPVNHTDPGLKNEQFDTGAFNEAVQTVPLLGAPASTQLWISGAAVHSGIDEFNAGAPYDRDYAERAISRMARFSGISSASITIDWNATRHDLAVTLDCPAGVLLVQAVQTEF